MHWSERQEILKAGTHPLPFVQQGMLVCVVGRLESQGCTVLDVDENAAGVTVARLQGVETGHRQTVSCEELRRNYTLLCDFDPNLGDDDENEAS